MDLLLTMIVTWLAATTPLPPTDQLPMVHFLPPIEIAFVVHGATTEEEKAKIAAIYADQDPKGREIVSAYDGRTATILLATNWSAAQPADLSVLVHETVHHLQEVAQLRYHCPQEREKSAYAAQEKWLSYFGTSLEAEFQIDPMTLLVTTECMK